MPASTARNGKTRLFSEMQQMQELLEKREILELLKRAGPAA
jgi:hypothetical protein